MPTADSPVDVDDLSEFDTADGSLPTVEPVSPVDEIVDIIRTMLESGPPDRVESVLQNVRYAPLSLCLKMSEQLFATEEDKAEEATEQALKEKPRTRYTRDTTPVRVLDPD